ncbi:single-stranded DNA-binding protein [Alteraurantiacibacter buctensis]|uniref:Single-stranded DNA-binding protein n=1 Tax=Alteraurantiacibacter buctensis TaxID=1503981 RepID=A0A844YZA7_9SPHN|nr:single-stranded DNA-binding protein [Alteraurantiacibacter buctensis]MXO72889.1 single-stranded DNA-binding protein [Alteraurantiacibacter buctensis]
MQTITIAGRIGRDAETRRAGDDSVTGFTVAVDQRNGRDKTTNWWRVSLWGIRRRIACWRFSRELERNLAARRAARMNGQVYVRPYLRGK